MNRFLELSRLRFAPAIPAAAASAASWSGAALFPCVSQPLPTPPHPRTRCRLPPAAGWLLLARGARWPVAPAGPWLLLTHGFRGSTAPPDLCLLLTHDPCRPLLLLTCAFWSPAAASGQERRLESFRRSGSGEPVLRQGGPGTSTRTSREDCRGAAPPDTHMASRC